MSRNAIAALILTILCLPLGCMGMASGGDATTAQEAAPGFGYKAGSTSSLDRNVAYATDDLRATKDATLLEDGDGMAGLDEGARGSGETTTPVAVEGRKLIRTGSMSVVVDDYEPFQAALEQRVHDLGGFVSNASLSHYSGRVSWATLTIRVPAAGFEELVGWAETEVEVQSLDLGTQDVTEEWVDVRSRIENGKRTESRLLELLDDRTADLEDVLAVERELARVRYEIEQAEGRMRVLADQVDLATLTLSVSVRNPYEPAVDPPGFGQMIADTFWGSLNAMVTAGKAIVLIATGAAPWLLVLFLGFYICYRILRALLRRKSK